jgi:hypothetical protein
LRRRRPLAVVAVVLAALAVLVVVVAVAAVLAVLAKERHRTPELAPRASRRCRDLPSQCHGVVPPVHQSCNS